MAQSWVGLAILSILIAAVLWGLLRIVSGIRDLRRSEKAFLEDLAASKHRTVKTQDSEKN